MLLFFRTLCFFLCVASLALAAPKKKTPPPPNPKVDHAGILLSMDDKAYQAGEVIYKGLCVNCHGADGKTAPLPTARAFGSQPFKFGSDPYSIFLTLTKGNGLMGPMLHLSPLERYQVTHYITEKYVRPFNNGYQSLSDTYLNKLPKGTDMGKADTSIERDFGPGLASQLGTDISSVMTLKLQGLSLSYNLHTMDQADIWEGGYLNLKNTQHIKLRGGGVVEPEGKKLIGLQGWQWAHEGRFDYPTEHLLPRGPMPSKWMDYKGHYLYGDHMIFSYRIEGRSMLEMPEALPGAKAVIHHFEIQPGKTLKLSVAKLAPQGLSSQIMSNSAHMYNQQHFTAAKVFGDIKGLSWEIAPSGRMVLTIPANSKAQSLKLIRYTGQGEKAKQSFIETSDLVAQSDSLQLSSMTKGGPQRWSKILSSRGVKSEKNDAYVIDTLTLPEKNPWNTWFRTSALDFFSDGRMALATHGGDVWIVSNIDEDLQNLKWKRYAAGLYEPFGLKVVDDVVYVTCKDRLTRLHDFNQDGEADFYESFYADEDVSTFFHAFNFDLQTDKAGNFYYAKAGQYTSYKLPGSVIKVGPEGGKAEVYCTGFRTPNGMGITNTGLISVSDNEGNWMPASKVSLTKPGGFYGYVQTKTTTKWQPDGGNIDVTKVVPPKTYDQPLMWIPKHVDNSSGGQLWVDDQRWGPLSGRFLHTSFGKGHLYYFLTQEVGKDLHQGALVRLPHDFETGIMRARVNPADGQVYATGLNGWNGGGRKGLTEGGVQRLRYTGQPLNMLHDWKVSEGKIELYFNFPISQQTQHHHIQALQWNYLWSDNYGSKKYSLKNGKPGQDELNIESLKVDPTQNKITLIIPNLKPVQQIEMELKVQAADGTSFEDMVWMTLHRVEQL